MGATKPPVIGFLTDFGLDGAAATCRAVMLSICPDAQIVDVSHSVQKYAIEEGAFLLRSALPYFPVGVHVGVVDPGVGTSRRPVAIKVRRGDLLIGPDNGLLVPAAEALGGVEGVRELGNRELWLPATTSTFHGRDMFSPVAAHLANGDAAFEDVGAGVDPATLVRLPNATAKIDEGLIETEAIYVDSFGNVRLAGGRAELASAFGELQIGDVLSVAIARDEASAEVTFAPSFGHVDEGALLLYVDSTGNLALAVNQGDFTSRHPLRTGSSVVIRRA